MFAEHEESVSDLITRLAQFNLPLDVDDWVTELDSINPYDVHPKVSYKLIMVVEDKPNDYKKISMIQFYTHFQQEPAILAISAVDVYDLIYHCDVNLPYIPTEYKKLILLACTESAIHLKRNQSVPVDLLGKLIKIKVMMAIWKMVYKTKADLGLINETAYYAPPPAAGKGGKKSGKPAKDGKKKDKGKGKGKGKDKKGKPETFPCDNVVNKAHAASPAMDDERIPQINLYIMLIGFHNHHLLDYLARNGFRLSILIRFGESLMGSSIENAMQAESSFYVRNLSTNVETDLYAKKTNALRFFWDKATEMYGKSYQYHLDESFIMNYTCPILAGEMPTSDVYLKLSEMVFCHFLEALRNCEEFRSLHKIYLDHLKVHKLGYGAYMTTEDMPYYEANMDGLPLPMANPVFVIEGLLDEIVIREQTALHYPDLDEETYKQIKEDYRVTSATKWESMYPSSSSSTSIHLSCEKVNSLYETKAQFCAELCDQNQTNAFECHISFTDQIKRLLNYHRDRIIQYRKKNRDIYQFLPALDKAPFIIHERNSIDRALNYYKYIPECARDIWTTYLSRHPYIQFCKNIPRASDEDEHMYREQLSNWADLLEVNIDELVNSLLLLFYGKSSCIRKIPLESDSFFVTEHFRTQRVHCNIDYMTDITTMANTGNHPLNMETIENYYEKLSPSEFKWLEDLSPNVALQVFHEARNDYCCIDYKPIEMFNAIMFRFHNDCDEFGLNQKRWNITLRTPVNFREFMHMTVFKDTQFLLAHESKRKAMKQFYDDIVKYEKTVLRFTPTEQDFLFKESLKALLSNPVDIPATDTKKKGKKGAKGKQDKKGSKKTEKIGKAKPKKDTNPRNVVEKNAFEPGMSFDDLVEDNEMKMHVKKLTLPALDFNEGLLNLDGSTTTFHSLDNFTVAIDKYKVTSYPVSISASIALNGNSLHIHKNIDDDFAFHVNLKNGGIASFGKSPSIPEKKIKFYLVEELQSKHFHCLGGTVPKRREVILASTFFHDMIKIPEINIKEGMIRRASFPGGGVKRQSKFSIRSISSKRPSWMTGGKPARLVESISSIIPIKGKENKANRPVSINNDPAAKSSLGEEKDAISQVNLQGFIDDIMRFKELLPTAKFKILSSPLHRYSYIKRKKSDIELILADIVRYVLNMHKIKHKFIRVKHAYNLNSGADAEFNEHPANGEPSVSFRVTLPNGLHIKNMECDGTCIVQSYISKGPESESIADEKYRIFLRNGSIAVRKNNGDFLVYQPHGQIIHYQIPLNKRNWSPFLLFKKKDDGKRKVEKLLGSTNRRVRRTNKNVLEGYKCSHTISRTSGSHRRKQFKCKKALILKEIKFKVTACDGTAVYYHNGNMTLSPEFTCDIEEHTHLHQTIFRRSDGTITILTKAGVIETTFPDGTRISSWCDGDPELIELELRERGFKGATSPFAKMDVFYQFEHPNYACVTLDTVTGDMKFIVPGDIELQTSNDSCSLISDRTTLINVDRDRVVLESIPCESCNKNCICKINSKPLFRNEPVLDNEIFFKAKDTFDKLLLTYFDGNVKKNNDYIKEQMPCNADSHTRYPTQKVMVMFDDFRAKYFWSETMYANRMADVIASENTELVLYVNDWNHQVDTTEIRTFEPNFYNGHFRMPYLPSMLPNSHTEPKFDLAKPACMKHRLLQRVSMSSLIDLLRTVHQDEKLAKNKYVKAFDIKNFVSTFFPRDASEIYFQPAKSKSHTKESFKQKIKSYKQKLGAIYKQVIVAKDKTNLTPYFQKSEPEKRVSAELLTERAGASNRSLSGSILDTITTSTTMSEGYDISEYLETEDDQRIYERQPSYTSSAKNLDDDVILNNIFSICTLDELEVTPIKSSTVVQGRSKKGKSILVGKPSSHEVKRPESKLRFAESPKENSAISIATQESTSEDESQKAAADKLENPPTEHSGRDHCMVDLLEVLRDLILQGSREEDLAASQEELEETSDDIFNDVETEVEADRPGQITRKIEQFFNIIQEKVDERRTSHVSTKSVSIRREVRSMTDSIDSESGIVSGKDYVTSPSLQTVTSQMLKPTALQQFSNFEIQALLEEAGVTPLMYHEISELDLVKQLMGLAGVMCETALKERLPQEVELPQYEGMICDKKVEDEDEDSLESGESIVSVSSSSSSNTQNEDKEAIGEEECTAEEDSVEGEITPSVTSDESMMSLHKGFQESAISMKASVFDFPLGEQDERNVSREPSMIPLLNEKSLLRAIKKGIKRVTDVSSTQIVARPERPEMSVDISSSTSSSDVLPVYYESSSSGLQSYSTSGATYFPSQTSRSELSVSEKGSIESPTPQSSTSTVNISPSMKVFRDRSSYESKFFNVMVQSVGVQTASNIEAETETDIPYGDNM